MIVLCTPYTPNNPTSTQVTNYSSSKISSLDITGCHLWSTGGPIEEREFNPSAEVQLAYSTAPVDWVLGEIFKPYWKIQLVGSVFILSITVSLIIEEYVYPISS